jgi:hypothetical protein
MSSFIALQDLCAKPSPRSVAFEKKTGCLKLFNYEGSINAFLHLSDFHSRFSIQVLSSSGIILADTFLKFDRNMYPKVNPKNNYCSFGFRLLELSSLSHKSFFYLVASWVTNSQTARFLVSGAFAACYKNTIFGQSNEHCSYLSLSCFDSEVQVSNNNRLDLSNYYEKIMVFARSEMPRNYIVYQPQGLSLSNHRDAVISAVVDMFKMNLITDCKNELQLLSTLRIGEGEPVVYSQIDSFSQSIFESVEKKEVINTTLYKLIEVNHNNDSILLMKNDVQSGIILQFTLTRSVKHCNERKNEIM